MKMNRYTTITEHCKNFIVFKWPYNVKTGHFLFYKTYLIEL